MSTLASSTVTVQILIFWKDSELSDPERLMLKPERRFHITVLYYLARGALHEPIQIW